MSDKKKLAEIGGVVLPWSYKYEEETYIFTKEQRRELVRRVWEAACENEQKRSIARPYEFPIGLEQFIEEQGL